MKNTPKNWLGFVLLFVAGLILTHRLTQWQDLQFGDETTYLGSGAAFAIPFPGGVQWGPLYAAWYAFWHLFIPDLLDLYYFNWVLLSILAGLLTFVYYRSFRVSFWISVFCAVLFLFSPQNLPINPKISLFPFCLILAALALFNFWKAALPVRILLLGFVALLCAYCRPEFYISFLLAIGWAALVAFRRRPWRGYGWLVGFLVASTCLHLLFGLPLSTGESNRSNDAFQQHFVINYSDWNGQPQPLTIKEQMEVFHGVFGAEVESMSDAFRTKPGLVVKHLFSNFQSTFQHNLRNFWAIFFQTLFIDWYARARLVLVGLVVLAALFFLDYRKTWRGLVNAFDLTTFGATLLMTLPALLAAILVYPRVHYLVFHVLWLFYFTALLFKSVSFREGADVRQVPLAIRQGVLFLLLLGWLGIQAYQAQRRTLPTPAADNVRYLNALTYQGTLRTLERDWYWVMLRHHPVEWIHVEEQQEDFIDFVRRKDINLILMTQDMQHFYAQDESFQLFLEKYPQEGFQKRVTNAQGDYLLIRNSLLLKP
ncbi:hypothetical protein GCM10027275_28450 [Rhabdobacter roseus]|uniref:Glycosyltransferase RgtA/B/C/D-like domain-containing protein n=1 Tax=Rhabdobacter roseus TaxID=1655419 RepID=A0A840TN44_9BACT|nr:hypothetical protein [Rhabdobacter roseus]MBB5284794.1 hypothetical protein [Rhabdobacter roseus]